MKTTTTFALASVLTVAAASAAQVRVTITNNAPTGGVALTPVWVGFHDGSFDSYDGGLSSQAGLEEIAELGSAATLDADFQAGRTYVSGGVSGVTTTSQTIGRVSGSIGAAMGPPPLQPGESNSATFDVFAGSNTYFSYVSMVLPSSDYFVANGNPLEHSILDIINNGGSLSFNIGGLGGVTDAGTEVNDFATSPGNPLFGLPAGVGTDGLAENGVNVNVTSDPYGGFLNNPGGLDPNLDFTNASLYSNGIATITIERIPEPSSVLLTAVGALGLISRRRRA